MSNNQTDDLREAVRRLPELFGGTPTTTTTMRTILALQDRMSRVAHLVGAIGFTLEMLPNDAVGKALSELVQVTGEAIDAANESIEQLKAEQAGGAASN